MADTSEVNTGKRAIARCMRAWNYAYKKETARLGGPPNGDLASQAANTAYLRAMPVLAGYQHTCDFIACINFASTSGILTPIEAQHYLTNAKIAISVVCHRPPSAARTSPRFRGFASSLKTSAPTENEKLSLLPPGGRHAFTK